MGMGDIKPPYSPTHKRVFDPVVRQYFADCLMRPCPHPKVQEKFGEDCCVSVYVCKKCQFSERYDFHDAVGCKYEANS